MLFRSVRSLGNVSYDTDVGYLQIGDATSERTLTVNTAKSFAQTLLLMEFARSQIRTDRHSTIAFDETALPMGETMEREQSS